MRGADRQTGKLFSYASPESLVPQDHPLRAIRVLVNAALERLSPAFGALYADTGRPSIPPEKLLRALLLQALFTVRSERQLMQQITCNMLFRWFVGLAMDAPVWDVTVFTKNRDRLLEGDIARGLLAAILADPQVAPLLSTEHFSVDGTLIEAWASMTSFRPKDGSGEPPAPGRNGERDFHGEKRSNETHASTADADARLFKKAAGQASRLCHMGHVLMENRNALVVDTTTTTASGTAEREAAGAMVGELPEGGRITLGGGQGLRHPGLCRRDAPPRCDTACLAEHHGAALRHRWPNHAPSRPCDQRACSQAHRGSLRLDRDGRRPAQDPPSRHRSGRLDVHLRRGRLQPGAHPEAAGGCGVVTPGVCPRA